MIFKYNIHTQERQSLSDITPFLKDALDKSKVKDGLLCAYVPHATAAVIINENHDPNVCKDILSCLSKLIPEGVWMHDRVDGNADAHIKASICGPSETIPVKEGRLMLGTWQSPMLACFDGPRDRTLIVSIIKEK